MQSCIQAEANEDWEGPDSRAPVKTTGIDRWCPLSVLFLWCMIWDFPGDMMHTIKNFWEARVVPTFKGERKPAANTQPKGKEPGKEDPEYVAKKKKNEMKAKQWTELHDAHVLCTMHTSARKVVDGRVKNLCGRSDWVRHTMVNARQLLFVL
jgi:hypothetical protein